MGKAGRAKGPPRGVVHPAGLGSSKVNQQILSEANSKTGGPSAGEAVLRETAESWRTAYHAHHFRNLQLLADPLTGVEVAKAGLEAAHAVFRFVRQDGSSVSTQQLLDETVHKLLQQGGALPSELFQTARVRGEQQWDEIASRLVVPYAGKKLQGPLLLKQIEAWVNGGIIEVSAGASLKGLVGAHGAWLDLRGHHFVVLGAGSQLGPTSFLLHHGATVYAVDLPSRPKVWARLIDEARNSRGQLVFPVRENTEGASFARLAELAGANLLTEPAEIATWIIGQAPGERLSIGNYTYVDGANFVRLSVAADLVQTVVCSVRPNTALALLCSPTECFAVTADSRQAAAERYDKWSPNALWYAPMRVLSKGRYLEKNDPLQVSVAQPGQSGENVVYLQDSYVWTQGNNYAMAKQLQRWRALVARSEGHTVSANVGPASLTHSVLHNRLVAAGMYGCAHFGVEPFEVGTANSVMTSLLIHDLACETSAAQPGTFLPSPLALFTENAVHGGVWRCAYKTNSVTEVAALVYLLSVARPYLLGLATGALLLSQKGRSRL